MFAIAMELMSGGSLEMAFPTDLLAALDLLLQITRG
jgi:hypothetical protein